MSCVSEFESFMLSLSFIQLCWPWASSLCICARPGTWGEGVYEPNLQRPSHTNVKLCPWLWSTYLISLFPFKTRVMVLSQGKANLVSLLAPRETNGFLNSRTNTTCFPGTFSCLTSQLCGKYLVFQWGRLRVSFDASACFHTTCITVSLGPSTKRWAVG